MDIHRLLTPSERDERASASPNKGQIRPKSNLSSQSQRSPGTPPSPSSRPTTAHDSPTRPLQAFPLHDVSRAVPGFRPLHPPPTSHPASMAESSADNVATSNYARPLLAQRTASTPQIERLSDSRLPASRTLSANNVTEPDAPPSRRSSNFMNPVHAARAPAFQVAPRKQSLVDLTMSEAAAQTPPPRVFESKALTAAESQRVTSLLNYLNEHSYAYESHVELINLLHKGFVAHTGPSADVPGEARRDPRDYGLLKALRQAREAMDTRFAVGEDIWDEWLSDEVLLVSSVEERFTVTELFQKAVQDEPASVKLWQMYAGWVWINWTACNSPNGSGGSNWSDEDKAMCKDLFTRELIIQVLEQAIASTQWRVDESHVVWNRYAELVQEDFPANPSGQELERLRNMYVARLQFPHSTWEETNQMFWSIVSKYEGSNWEAIMADVQRMTGPAKTQMSQRGPHEHSLRRAMESGDREAIWQQFAQYLHWERKREWKQRQRSAFDQELRKALYERALLRFPTTTEWWIDYVDFVISSDSSTPVLPLIERATRHCPWSGDLWARRILQSDVEGKSHHDIEATKHRATNSGLRDAANALEEMVKVLQQWCSFLRRRAFSPQSTEDDLDTAEVGITMALEDIQQAGTKLYGKDFPGDPLFRLESIQIKFLSQARRFEDARKIYQSNVKLRKNSYDFWSAYYHWELWLWGFDRVKEAHRIETQDNGPDKATGVVQQALSQRDLDYPDKVMDMYLNHFQQHESGQRLRTALVDAREFQKQLASRRVYEASEQAAAQPQPVPPPPMRAPEQQPQRVSDSAPGEKRKRAEEVLPNGHSEKKTRTESISTTETLPAVQAPEVETAQAGPQSAAQESSASASAQIKRDREHNTITVKDLPSDIQELDVKKFFRDIGAPLSINILADKGSGTATATVEFETHEDVLAAKTRSGKPLKGNEVRIQSGTQSTLYVANYPPEFDEVAIRKLFEGYGDIVSVRFPSLKYNNRRRFCYVQFLTSDMAKKASAEMDEKMLDGSHKLLVKISDPEAKKQRAGAQAEGRELFVKNIERNVPDSEIRQFFEQFGEVVSMNLVKLVSGKKTGTGFIVFASGDEANAALQANNKPFHDRILHVELASAKGRAAPMDRARKEDIIVSHASSATPEPDATNGRRPSDVSVRSNTPAADDSWKTAKERKVAIFSLPDTVNDSRIKAAMEAHGPLVKIQMRRQDNGAIVEFQNVKDAFNVRQGVDCSALGTDVKTGDVADLLAKVKKRQESAEGGSVGAEAGKMRPSAFNRPTQRGGRRGGLGFKRGGGFATGKPEDKDSEAAAADSQAGAKSNADFRNLFEKSKSDAATAGDGADRGT